MRYCCCFFFKFKPVIGSFSCNRQKNNHRYSLLLSAVKLNYQSLHDPQSTPANFESNRLQIFICLTYLPIRVYILLTAVPGVELYFIFFVSFFFFFLKVRKKGVGTKTNFEPAVSSSRGPLRR